MCDFNNLIHIVDQRFYTVLGDTLLYMLAADSETEGLFLDK